MRHSESEFIASDGLRIFTQSWQPEGDGDADVLLLHGLGEHSGRYAQVAAALVAVGYAVHALDHRGHGRSAGKRAFVRSYAEFHRDIAQFRAAIAGQRPLVVMGHSMGGNLALGHVLDQPDGVAALVLSGPALKVGESVSKFKIRVAMLLAKIAPGVRAEALDASAISRDPAVVAAYRSDPLVFTGKISVGLAAALIGAIRAYPARYGELRLPLLIQHGTADQLADVEGSRQLEASARKASVTAHYYDGLFHEVYNEPEHDRVVGDLVDWLSATIRPGRTTAAE